MKPLDFYRLGLQMASSASSETEYRTAISRIYYGLHHESCCRYFRREVAPAPLNRNRRHTELRDRFNSLSGTASNTIGGRLNDLIIIRNEADYQLVSPLRYKGRSYSVEQLIYRAVSLAQELLDALETYSPGEASDGCNCPTVYSSR
ncbi:MAG: hypothetical protein F4X34_04040 [Chloroflexi bacterium]|nr:hypothetical protein [Chloroflexota bacterium]